MTFKLPEPPERSEDERKGVLIKFEMPLYERLRDVCEEGGLTLQFTIVSMVESCLDDVEAANEAESGEAVDAS